jgi:hypothetical protein
MATIVETVFVFMFDLLVGVLQIIFDCQAATRPASAEGAQSGGMSQAKPALSVAEIAFAMSEL